jgi:flagellar hook-associated protein 3 FlgL
MRVTQMQSDRTFLTNIDRLNSNLELVNQQVSSGKKLLSLKDSPSASAELVGLSAQLVDIDQYQANADAGSLYLGVADSALSSVHTLVTTIFTKGSAATSNILDPTERAALAGEIRSLRDEVLSLANSETQGRYIFAGSASNAPAFTITGDTVTYQGDQVFNAISVGDGVTVPQGFAGDSVFSPVFATINQLLTAVDGGDAAGMQTALSQFSTTLGGLNTFRVQLGVSQNTILDLKNEQDAAETSIISRQSSLQDADMAQAVTQLQQIQTALQAALTARSIIQQKSLFDYLG